HSLSTTNTRSPRVALPISAFYVTYHKVFFYDEILQSIITGYDTLEVFISILVIMFVLEATRRTVGIPIVIVNSVATMYAIFGKYIHTQILFDQSFNINILLLNL